MLAWLAFLVWGVFMAMGVAIARPSLNLPRLRPDQFEIAASPAKIKVVACGRRWGKSLVARTIGFMIAAAGGRVAWVVPTYKNAKSTWREVERVAKELATYRVEINRTEKVIEFPNGGFLGIYSADNADSLRGDGFHLVVLDEAAFMPAEVFSDVVMATVADTGGTIMAIGTPHGRNWFYDVYKRGLPGRDKDPDIQSWHAPTMANPMPSIAKWIRLARELMTQETFRQEVLAQFLEGGGEVFRNVDEVCSADPLTGPLPGHIYVCGVDLAKLRDYTIFCVFDKMTGQQVAYERYQRIDYKVQAQKLADLHRKWRFKTIVVEQNNIGEVFIEQCKPFRMPIEKFLTKNETKGAIIASLSVAFENKSIRLINNPIQREEFKIFQQTLTPSGLPKYGAPEHKHDDFVMAVALGYTKVAAKRKASISLWNGKIA